MGLSGEYERAPTARGWSARGWSLRASFGQLAGWLAGNFIAERERWPLLLPVAMGAGIGIYFWLHREPPLWLGPALAVIALTFILIAWRHPRPRLAAAALLALSLGFAAAELQAHWVASPVLQRRVFGVVEGRVLDVEPLPEGSRILIAPASLGDLAPEQISRARAGAAAPRRWRLGAGRLDASARLA